MGREGRQAAGQLARLPRNPGPRTPSRRRSSRLGSQVVLSKALNGSLFALGRLAPWKTL